MIKAIGTWAEDAHLVEEVYGGYVNWEEEFYICPECQEPIYREDYEDGYGCCPICEFDFATGETRFDESDDEDEDTYYEEDE